MLLRFTCPGCQCKVAAEIPFVGKTVYCPQCRTAFPLRSPEGSATADEPLALTAPDALEPSLIDDSPLGAFAQKAGINPAEVGPSTVPDSKAAKTALDALKNELPPVESAYRPSGVMPVSALGYMILGVPIGTVIGALAGGICAAIVGLVLWGVMAFNLWLVRTWNIVCGLAVLIAGLIGFVGAIVVFCVAGAFAAACITGMGKAGNNRNATYPALLALVTGPLAVGLLWLLFQEYGVKPLEAILDVNRGTLDTVYLITFAVGAVIAAATAVSAARSDVRQTKFCEDCQVYMKAAPLPELRLGLVKLLAAALRQHDLPMAVAALSGTAKTAGTAETVGAIGMAVPERKEGTATLFHCPQCDKGFLEATAQFKVTWKGDDSEEEKSESWLVASVELLADEVERFKPFVSTPAPS
jgi:hypothetical protein